MQRRTSWAAGLELVGDDERCVALAGLLPVRLLAEQAGLRAGISAAMSRPGFDPDYDRVKSWSIWAWFSSPGVRRSGTSRRWRVCRS